MKPGVIILGGHVQALGIARSFGRQSIPVDIIDNTNLNITRHSKYCRKSYTVKDNQLLDLLLSFKIKDDYKNWLVFPTNDFHVKLLSQNKPALNQHFKVTTDDWNVIRMFYNKTETYRLAQTLNIPIAETFYPFNEKDLYNISPAFPCIIKPAVMHNFYRKTKRKVFICKNYDELVRYYREASGLIPADEIIVQNIIPGPSRNQYSACFLSIDGKPFVTLTACRMRQHPLDFGNATTYAETQTIPEIAAYAEKILKEVNYTGLCEVEFKKDENDGQYKLLEVNPRTWKWHSIAEKAGTPFLLSYYHWLSGKNIEPVLNQSDAAFRHAITDWPGQIKLFLKGHDYAFRKKQPLVKAVWARDDKKPWLFEKLYLPSLIIVR